MPRRMPPNNGAGGGGGMQPGGSATMPRPQQKGGMSGVDGGRPVGRPSGSDMVQRTPDHQPSKALSYHLTLIWSPLSSSHHLHTS